MDNENSQTLTDLDDTLVINEKRILSSTRIEDPSDQSVIEIRKEIPIIELEDTATSFVVEDSGVIHIKTEKISKTMKSALASEMESQDGQDKKSIDKEQSVDNGDLPKDVKREDAVLRKNDSTIADVYLELDVTDNLDTYLKRERIRKLYLSKTADKFDKNVTSKKTDIVNEKSLTESETDTSLNETVIQDKKASVKRAIKDPLNNKDNTKEETKESMKENNKENRHPDEIRDSDAIMKIQLLSSESKTSVASKSDISSRNKKNEQCDSDKKDRFLWVSNVNRTTKATDLKMHLAAFGKVQLAKIVTDGKECFGYVIMETSDDVVNCINNLQNSTFEGKEIVLSDKMPEKKRCDKSSEVLKDKEIRKSEWKIKESTFFEEKDIKTERPDYRKDLPSDPLTLKVSDSKQKRYSEERRRIEAFERKRYLRDRISAERRDIERKRKEMEREREREKERERQREREREQRRRESERQKQIEIKLEKERKKLEYERKMIEKEKFELLRFKRKLLSKEKETEETHDDHKRRRSPEKYDRKKYAKIEEHGAKHSTIEIPKPYWKNENPKSIPHDMYKKSNQEICVVPPPPVLSNNYHSPSERPRSTDRDKQWYERKEYENRPKSFVRKIEDNRSYPISTDGRQSYPERSFPKEQYKHKDYNVMQQHNSWNGYTDTSYKEQNIPVLRSEIPRTMHPVRHQTYQEGSYAAPSQEYYPGSGYRRVTDYYNRPTERKY